MTALSRSEFNSFISTTLPDNSSREISASDLRQSFFNLADSISLFNNNIEISSLNFGELSNTSIYGGSNTFARKSTVGFSTANNTAFGHSALESSYSTNNNTAVGSHSLSCASLGVNNSAFGVNALGGLTLGSGNVGIGNYTLLRNKTGNFNIALGYGAGYNSDKDEDFKFYVGVYPDASGDCDTTLDSLTKAPLLYGDLQTLQLAIGASGFRGNEKLAVSGHIYPYEHNLFDLGSSSYRWNTAYIHNLDLTGSITSVEPLYEIYIADQTSTPDLILTTETLRFAGISGTDTIYDPSTNIMHISSHNLSGVMDASGNYLENLINESGNAISGWANYKIDASGSAVSGWSNYTIDASGTAISGYGLYQTNLISGISNNINFFGPSGLAWNVSGWARSYADSIGAAAGAYTHWTVSDGTNGRDITAPPAAENILVFDGISGVETNYRSDTNTLEISSRPISGILQYAIDASGTLLENLINTSGNAISGWTEHTIDASGNLLENLINASGNAISGWAEYKLDASGNLLENLINESGNAISGWADYTIDASGAALSGYVINATGFLDGKITQTGVNMSGWVKSISGILQDQIEYSGAYLYNLINTSGNAISGWADSTFVKTSSPDVYGHWTILDQDGTSENIDGGFNLKFIGISGVETNYRSDLQELEISSRPVSGFLEDLINDSGNAISGWSRYHTDASGTAISGWARYHIDASGNAISGLYNDLVREEGYLDLNYVKLNVYDDFVESIFGGPDVSLIESLSGILSHTIDGSGSLLSDLINESGNAISGWADYHFFNKDKDLATGGIVARVSGYSEDYTDYKFNSITDAENPQNGLYRYWTLRADDASNQDISPTEKVKFEGSYGLSTSKSDISNSEPAAYRLIISAEGISGWASGTIDITSGILVDSILDYANVSGAAVSGYGAYQSNLISGVSPDINFFGPSGLAWNVSGWSRHQIDNSGNHLEYKLDASGADLQFDIDASGAAISGWAEYTIDGSGSAVSGWSHYTIDASGSAVSGWANSTFAKNQPGGNFTDWDVGDGTKITSITPLNKEVNFVGISGIETNLDTPNSDIEISARPISGILQYTIEDSGRYLYDLTNASGNAISGWAGYNLNYLNNGSKLSEFYNVLLIDDRLNGNNIYLSGVAISGWASGTIEETSGILVDRLDASGNNLKTSIEFYAYESGVAVSGWASGTFEEQQEFLLDQTNQISGWQPGYLVYDVSGHFENNFEYKVLESVSAGTGLLLDQDGVFHTSGSGHFNSVFLNKDNNDPSGQLIADSGQYHDIVNSSGYLVVPTYNQYDEITTLNKINPKVGSGVIAFAGGHLRVSDGNAWHRPMVIEGFMEEDLLAPSDYSSPESGLLITRNENFQASDAYYVTNRDHTFAASGGFFVMAMLVNNEYRPLWSTCSGCPACV